MSKCVLLHQSCHDKSQMGALLAVEQDGRQQSFHVVVPSLPGFAFSGQPRRPGYGPQQMGEAVNTLMLKLGYSRYVAQGAAQLSSPTVLHAADHGVRDARCSKKIARSQSL